MKSESAKQTAEESPSKATTKTQYFPAGEWMDADQNHIYGYYKQRACHAEPSMRSGSVCP